VSIFSPTQEEIQIIYFATLRFLNYLFFQRTVHNWTASASNVNHFGQSVSKLDTKHLRTDRRATDNSRLASCGVTCLNSSALLLLGFSGILTVCAPNSRTNAKRQNVSGQAKTNERETKINKQK
jgi:hypothetical protein